MSTKAPQMAQIVADGRAGGGTTMVLGLIDDLIARGGSELTVVSQPGSYFADQVLQRQLPFIGFDFFTGLVDISLPWRLARRLGEQRFELTHVHGLRAAHSVVRRPLRSRLGRLVYTVHGLHQLHQAAWLRWLANRAERQVMQRVDERVFVSQADARLAQRWRLLPCGKQGRVVYNGVDIAALGTRRQTVRDIDVLYIGRHVPQKGPEVAAHALALLAAQGRRCVLAGDGPLRAACIALLKSLPGGSAVELQAELPHDEALALLARTRVLVMPSRWEGLPILPIEAAALGVPVVASRLEGIAEVVDDGVTGLLTPPGDAAAMAHSAQRLLADPARWRTMQAAGPVRAAQHFNRAASSAAYALLYDELLRGAVW